VLWLNRKFFDLNDLATSGSPYLLYANDINDSGEIVGEAFDPATGNAPAFVAVLQDAATASARVGTRVSVPEAVLNQAERRGSRFGMDPR
jgi:hypothetical protein